jgi:hypothetical protein
MEKIDINKKYKTRSGEPVVIYTTEAGGNFPVHACIKKGDNSNPINCLRSYSIYGTVNYLVYEQVSVVSSVEELPFSLRCDLDLVEVNPYEDYTIDAKVKYRYFFNKPILERGHFAGLNNKGVPMVFPNGKSSFTYDYDEDGELEVVEYIELIKL